MAGEKKATRDAYGEALVKLGHENPNIVVLDADLSKSTKTAEFAKVFPNRFFQMGIAEQDMMATAAGLATTGKTAFASTFAIFATGRAYEQVRNSVAYPRLNVKVAATHAGVTVGEDGGSHQAIEDIALMRVIPGMTVIVPCDGPEATQAVFEASKHEGPVYLRFGREATPIFHDEGFSFAIGKGETLRTGNDVTIVACGVMVAPALEAAGQLAGEGVSARVINMATIKPIDADLLLTAARETGALVTAEEHSVIGGLGSAVAEVLVRQMPVPVEMVGIQDRFGQSGKPAELLKEYGLTSNDIAAAAKKAIARKK